MIAIDDPRHAALRLDVETRLRRVCAGMTSEEFTDLVQRICAAKVRWAANDEQREQSA